MLQHKINLFSKVWFANKKGNKCKYLFKIQETLQFRSIKTEIPVGS